MVFLTTQEVDIHFPPYQPQENFLTQYFVLRHRLREPKAGPSRNPTSDQVAHFRILWDVKAFLVTSLWHSILKSDLVS